MARTKLSGLGRGLDSLFADSGFDPQPVSITPEKKEDKASEHKTEKETKNAETVEFIRLTEIKPNAKQPRKTFDQEALNDLAASIKENGIIQPILVRPAKKGYELVAGERRWRAARIAGLKEIPAIVRDLDERQNMFYALIENMQREDLNAVEEAKALKELMDTYKLNQEQAAAAVGKSRPYVANLVRLLKLPEPVQTLVEEKKLSAGHARAIAGLTGEDLQIEAAEKAVKEGLSVRQIEEYTGEQKPKKTRKRSKSKSPEIREAEERIREVLGTKVKIKGTEKKGKLELEYYSREELDRILEVLLADE